MNGAQLNKANNDYFYIGIIVRIKTMITGEVKAFEKMVQIARYQNIRNIGIELIGQSFNRSLSG